MSAPVLLLEVRAVGRRYYVPCAHIDGLELLRPDAPSAHDERGRPCLVRGFASLLWPFEALSSPPQQALVVRLRRRSVALLVDRVEQLSHDLTVQPLGPLFAHSLAAPWVLGAVATDLASILVLDLRRIAADLALGAL